MAKLVYVVVVLGCSSSSVPFEFYRLRIGASMLALITIKVMIWRVEVVRVSGVHGLTVVLFLKEFQL